MGQSAGSMGGRQSKDELLYQHVATGNIEAIKALCREGASLEVLSNHNNGAISLRFFCFVLLSSFVAEKIKGKKNLGLTIVELGRVQGFFKVYVLWA